MDNREKLGIWKRKVAELEDEISSLKSYSAILTDISNEIKSRKNAKLNILLEWIDLEDEIFGLKDWVEYHQNKVSKYKTKIDELKKEGEKQSQEEIKKQVRLLFEPKEKKLPLRFRLLKFPLDKLSNKNIAKYGIPIVLSLLLISVFFIAKPETTGQAVLSREKYYIDNLNIRINESSAYEWNVKNPGNIKSIRAKGSIEGNGTVRIYIEKDGKRHLVFDNKNNKQP